MGRHSPANEMSIAALLAGLLSGVIASMGMGGGAGLLIYLNLFTNVQLLIMGVKLSLSLANNKLNF